MTAQVPLSADETRRGKTEEEEVWGLDAPLAGLPEFEFDVDTDAEPDADG